MSALGEISWATQSLLSSAPVQQSMVRLDHNAPSSPRTFRLVFSAVCMSQTHQPQPNKMSAALNWTLYRYRKQVWSQTSVQYFTSLKKRWIKTTTITSLNIENLDLSFYKFNQEYDCISFSSTATFKLQFLIIIRIAYSVVIVYELII